MSDKTRTLLRVGCGSLFIATGSTLAGLFSFAGRLSVVTVGFLLFVVGYRLSQGLPSPDTITVPTLLRSQVDLRQLTRVGLLGSGLLGIAYGVTMFSQTVLDPSVSNAALAGVSSITGYMAAHVGINGVGLGETVFGPLMAKARQNHQQQDQ